MNEENYDFEQRNAVDTEIVNEERSRDDERSSNYGD